MGHPNKQPMDGWELVILHPCWASAADSLPRDRRQLDTLVELTEALLEKHGEEWLRQNGDVILEQWEMMLSLGI